MILLPICQYRKRTLYELFHDKEDLLLDVMRLHREEMKKSMEEIASKAENVLEVILRFYQKSVQDFQNTNRKFFEDMEKYPRVVAYIAESRKKKTWMPQWSFIKRGQSRNISQRCELCYCSRYGR